MFAADHRKGSRTQLTPEVQGWKLPMNRVLLGPIAASRFQLPTLAERRYSASIQLWRLSVTAADFTPERFLVSMHLQLGGNVNYP